jgi:hypothetical protein
MILGMAAWFCPVSFAQTPTQVPAPHPDPSIVTLDVVAQDAKTLAILPNLSSSDFRLLDNGREVPISSFGSGTHYSVAPIALWLIVECNNFEQHDFASAFMRGKTQYLRPGLARLDKTDTVGVAHWCGDGTEAIDLPPGRSADAAIGKLDELLKQKAVEGANRQGEDAEQKMIEMILDQARNATPRRLPVLLFLYGDAGFAYGYEAENVLRDLLATPDIVYGLNNAGYHFDPATMFGGGQIYYEIHYLSQKTGGQVYGTPDPKRFAKALDYLLLQLHFRYTLGLRPVAFDGKMHDLKVELTAEGQKKYADAALRYRTEYLAVKPSAGRAPK